MEIVKIQILLQLGKMDYLIFDTNLPNPIYPFRGYQQLIAYATMGEGEEYIKKHFPNIEYKVIDKRAAIS